MVFQGVICYEAETCWK